MDVVNRASAGAHGICVGNVLRESAVAGLATEAQNVELGSETVCPEHGGHLGFGRPVLRSCGRTTKELDGVLAAVGYQDHV
jgi:hypothetical protein